MQEQSLVKLMAASPNASGGETTSIQGSFSLLPLYENGKEVGFSGVRAWADKGIVFHAQGDQEKDFTAWLAELDQAKSERSKDLMAPRKGFAMRLIAIDDENSSRRSVSNITQAFSLANESGELFSSKEARLYADSFSDYCNGLGIPGKKIIEILPFTDYGFGAMNLNPIPLRNAQNYRIFMQSVGTSRAALDDDHSSVPATAFQGEIVLRSRRPTESCEKHGRVVDLKINPTPEHFSNTIRAFDDGQQVPLHPELSKIDFPFFGRPKRANENDATIAASLITWALADRFGISHKQVDSLQRTAESTVEGGFQEKYDSFKARIALNYIIEHLVACQPKSVFDSPDPNPDRNFDKEMVSVLIGQVMIAQKNNDLASLNDIKKNLSERAAMQIGTDTQDAFLSLSEARKARFKKADQEVAKGLGMSEKLQSYKA